MKLAIFTPEQLEPVIAEGCKGFANKNQWVNSLLSGISELVKKSPIAYRSFGPFWYPVKNLLQGRGLLQGEPVDPVILAELSMGSAELDLAAAFAFQEWTNDNQMASNNVFSVTTDEGESADYTLIDEEMEASIFAL